MARFLAITNIAGNRHRHCHFFGRLGFQTCWCSYRCKIHNRDPYLETVFSSVLRRHRGRNTPAAVSYEYAGLDIWQDHTKRGTSFSKRFGVVSSCHYIHYFRSWSFAGDFSDYRIDPVGYSQSYRTQWNRRAGVRLALLEARLGVGNNCSFHRRFNDFDCVTCPSCIANKIICRQNLNHPHRKFF